MDDDRSGGGFLLLLAAAVALNVIFALSRCDAADEVPLIRSEDRPYKIKPNGG